MTLKKALKIFNIKSENDLSYEKIKKIYHKLMKNFHPDLNIDNIENNNKISQFINIAYSYLRNYLDNKKPIEHKEDLKEKAKKQFELIIPPIIITSIKEIRSIIPLLFKEKYNFLTKEKISTKFLEEIKKFTLKEISKYDRKIIDPYLNFLYGLVNWINIPMPKGKFQSTEDRFAYVQFLHYNGSFSRVIEELLNPRYNENPFQKNEIGFISYYLKYSREGFNKITSKYNNSVWSKYSLESNELIENIKKIFKILTL